MIYKHTTFFNLLDACKLPGCPLCSLVNAGVHHYFQATLYEYVNDPKVRADLVASQGFCQKHAHDLLVTCDPLGAALMHESVLDEVVHSRDGFLRIALQARCPACKEHDQTLEHYGCTLIEALQEPEIVHAMEDGGPICLPHLRWLSRRARDKKVVTQLDKYARCMAKSLYGDLAAFVAAQNATDRSTGFDVSKQNPWRRAILFVSGTSK